MCTRRSGSRLSGTRCSSEQGGVRNTSVLRTLSVVEMSLLGRVSDRFELELRKRSSCLCTTLSIVTTLETGDFFFFFLNTDARASTSSTAPRVSSPCRETRRVFFSLFFFLPSLLFSFLSFVERPTPLFTVPRDFLVFFLLLFFVLLSSMRPTPRDSKRARGGKRRVARPTLLFSKQRVPVLWQLLADADHVAAQLCARPGRFTESLDTYPCG